MSNEKRNFDAIPASACCLSLGEVEVGDNGDKAKTAPVKLTARSGKAIEHSFWGAVVHDLSGMQLHKPRIPIDYVHDDSEVIGYLNRFDITSGDLVVTGALVPFKDSDRATEIIHKSKAGVPYEASINFGGEGIQVQELSQGEVTPVNGFMFEGPGIIIRKWPLRGVAICPYGADMNTSSNVLSDNNKTFSAAVVSAPKPIAEETSMSEVTVEAVAEAAKTEADAAPIEKPVETPVEVTPVDPVVPVEAVKVEGETEEQPPVAVEPEDTKLSRSEFLKIATEFGADIAAQTVRDGGDYTSALKLAFSQSKERIKALEADAAKHPSTSFGSPAPVVDATKTQKQSLFNTGK